MAITPAHRTTLYKEVTNQIIDLVKREEWIAGEKIPGEIELSKTFQVSRNCIREALKSLAHAGVLESQPGRGTYLSADAKRTVHTMELGQFIRDDHSFQELLEVRMMIEPQLIELVTERATEAEIAELEKTIEDTKIAVNSNQYSMKIGLSFHMGLVKIMNNRILTRIFNSIADELTVQRGILMLSHPDEQYLLRELNEHEEMFNNIKKRNGRQAKAIMEHHLRAAMDIMLKAELRGPQEK